MTWGMKFFSNGRNYLGNDGPRKQQKRISDPVSLQSWTSLTFSSSSPRNSHFIISANLNAGKSAPTGKLTLPGIAVAKSSMGGKLRGISIGLHLLKREHCPPEHGMSWLEMIVYKSDRFWVIVVCIIQIWKELNHFWGAFWNIYKNSTNLVHFSS